MAGVMPKVGLYLFLSLICLMLNLSIFFTALAQSEVDINSFVNSEDYAVSGDLPDDTNATIRNFVLSTGSSFVPFFSLLSIAMVGEDLPLPVTVMTGLVIGIISSIQVFLLLVIILNLAPKVLGSGWDV